jgi:putative ABC transport system permease protein
MRFSLLLLGVFAAIALLLASLGLYSVLATIVRQRTGEFGVRMALGAEPADIFWRVIGRGMLLSGLGITLGFASALGLTRLIAGILVGIKPFDPSTFAAVAALFLVIAAISCWLPARRAALLNPTEALRTE